MYFNIGFINLILSWNTNGFQLKLKASYPKRVYCLSFKWPNKAYYAYFKIKYNVIGNLVT